MPDTPDKAAERWWGAFLGGHRHPSQGVSHEDVSGPWFLAEHKYRLLERYSAEFKKAIKQYDENKAREVAAKGDRTPLVLFTFHGSRGQNARRFMMVEVFPKDGNVVNLLEGILAKIKSNNTSFDK